MTNKHSSLSEMEVKVAAEFLDKCLNPSTYPANKPALDALAQRISELKFNSEEFPNAECA